MDSELLPAWVFTRYAGPMLAALSRPRFEFRKPPPYTGDLPRQLSWNEGFQECSIQPYSVQHFLIPSVASQSFPELSNTITELNK